MRVLISSSEFPPGPGGIGTHAYNVTDQLHRLGHDVCVISSQDYSTDEAIAAFNAHLPFRLVAHRRILAGPLNLAHRASLVAREIRSWRPEVMIATGDRQIMAVAMLPARVPWICIEHGRKPETTWERAFKRWAFRRADAVVAVSNYSLARLLAMGVRPRASHVIPNGADPTRYSIPASSPKAQVLAGMGLTSGHLILSVGHVSARKGQDLMIEAMPDVLAKVPDAHYLVVGKPTKTPEFKALAQRLGVADHVHFLGQVEPAKLLELMGGCDLHVMTSRHTIDEFEGYGIAVVEAALCGKPSVVSGDSGLAEAVVDGETGLIAKIHDPADTARKVVELLVDDRKRGAMGQAANRRALAEQTWAQRVGQYEQVLESLLPATRRAGRARAHA